MKKRVWGIVLTVLGVLLLIFPTLTILNTVKAMPRPDPAEIGNNIVVLSRYYNLRFSFLLMAVGVVLLLGAAALFLSPVRRKAPLPVIEPVSVEDGAVATPAFGGDVASPVFGGDVSAPIPVGAPIPVFASEEARIAYEAELAKAGAAVESEVPPPVYIPKKKTVYGKTAGDSRLVAECYLRTRLTGTTFANRGGVSRQSVLSALTKGERVVFRNMRRHQVADSIGVFSQKGKQLGFLDVAFVRALREQYPDRSIDARVERIGGGNGLPYTCDLRIVVYRA